MAGGEGAVGPDRCRILNEPAARKRRVTQPACPVSTQVRMVYNPPVHNSGNLQVKSEDIELDVFFFLSLYCINGAFNFLYEYSTTTADGALLLQ